LQGGANNPGRSCVVIMWTEAQSDPTDADLIRRCQAGEVEAFDGLFERHRRPLYGYLRVRLLDHALAEDVVQESFVALARHMDRIDPRRGVSAWLFRVARNRAIDLLRKRGHEDTATPERLAGMLAGTPAPDGSAPEQMADRERDAALRAALNALPEVERDVLLMRFFGGLRFREIAAALRRPVSTVLWLSRRGLARLRQCVDG
jgi:RNA polymerase sigma-70 factor, ECF subfamily